MTAPRLTAPQARSLRSIDAGVIALEALESALGEAAVIAEHDAAQEAAR